MFRLLPVFVKPGNTFSGRFLGQKLKFPVFRILVVIDLVVVVVVKRQARNGRRFRRSFERKFRQSEDRAQVRNFVFNSGSSAASNVRQNVDLFDGFADHPEELVNVLLPLFLKQRREGHSSVGLGEDVVRDLDAEDRRVRRLKSRSLAQKTSIRRG